MRLAPLRLAIVAAFFVFGANAAAQSGRTVIARPVANPSDSLLEAQTTAVAQTLRCPVCQGESIQDSPSELAQQMRALVRDKLRAGETPAQIKSYFVARYGEWIMLEPRMTGLNVALYALPVLLVIGGVALVVFLVRRWTKPDEVESA